MQNFTLFTNSFLSYLLLFLICVAVVVAGVFLGIYLRKQKDKKEAAVSTDVTDNNEQ